MEKSEKTTLAGAVGHWTFGLGCVGLVVGAVVGLAFGMEPAVLDWFALSVTVLVAGATIGAVGGYGEWRGGRPRTELAAFMPMPDAAPPRRAPVSAFSHRPNASRQA